MVQRLCGRSPISGSSFRVGPIFPQRCGYSQSSGQAKYGKEFIEEVDGTPWKVGELVSYPPYSDSRLEKLLHSISVASGRQVTKTDLRMFVHNWCVTNQPADLNHYFEKEINLILKEFLDANLHNAHCSGEPFFHVACTSSIVDASSDTKARGTYLFTWARMREMTNAHTSSSCNGRF